MFISLNCFSKKDRRRIEKHAVKREDITTQAKFDRKKTRKNKLVMDRSLDN